jgi:hypothetical protein
VHTDYQAKANPHKIKCDIAKINVPKFVGLLISNEQSADGHGTATQQMPK